MFTFVKKIHGRVKDALVPPHPVISKALAFTMLSPKRLESLIKLCMTITKTGIRGDFVECGTCRGGSGAILAWAAKETGWGRNVYLFDSFQGHPSFTSNDAPDKDLVKEWSGTMVASQQDVVLALRSVEAYEPDHVKIIPGWFQESIPKADITHISLLHLDGDWYDSITFCLENLYYKVVPGGYIVVDDYEYYEGCKLAVDKFFGTRKLEVTFLGSVEAALVIHRNNYLRPIVRMTTQD